MIRILYIMACFILLAIHITNAEDSWPNWRGPDYNNTVTSGTYPIQWDPQKPLWKTEVPGKGFSTPVVWDQKIFLTSGVDGQDTVLAYDWSGKPLWQKALGPESAGKHQNGSGSNPSAVTDGKGVFAIFKSGNFAAFELDGSIRWQMNLFEKYGEDSRYWSFGTSPVVTRDYVVMAHMHDGDSWVAAFNKMTGDVVWKVPRNYETAQEGRQGYTTPVVYTRQGTEALLVWGGHHLTAYKVADGKLLWSCGDFNPEGLRYWPSVGSPTIVGDVVVTSCGRSDRNQPRLHGIKMGGSGDVTATHRLWQRDDIGPFIPCPTEYQGRVYLVDDRGKINCINPLTGKDYWNGVFPKGRGNYYSSPLVAGGHLYTTREDGMVFVLELKDEFKIISEIDMKDKIIASPIAVSNRLLIRTEHYLFCIGE